LAEPTSLLHSPAHRAALAADARALLAFHRASLSADGSFVPLGTDGTRHHGAAQELHVTTRMVHSYALGQAWGAPDCAGIIETGMRALWTWHRDPDHGGYVWAVRGPKAQDTRKLAYGHVFVLLAAASASEVGHDDAPRLLADIASVLERHFWDDTVGRLREEFAREWQPLSRYRGMNANMHGVEAFLAAYEATGQEVWLDRAGRILDFFTRQMAGAHDHRIPEHYTQDWQVDPAYRGDPVFRPPGTTPGHSLEFARLLLQHWDLTGRGDATALPRARALVTTALADAWLPDGGLAYTLAPGGAVDQSVRLWWPVTEGLAALAMLQKLDPQPQDAAWYARLNAFARAHFIDTRHGGWHPELGADGLPAASIFSGKPDIYHALQADLLALGPGVSRVFDGLRTVSESQADT
jgi:mannose/cellobiose epimerase-like protein (N-acyl-D-glucosamine 2-epimerase family)